MTIKSFTAGCLRRVFPSLVLIVLALGRLSPAAGDVVRVVVDRREVIAGGAEFGDAGRYERLIGRALFEFDPGNPHDQRINDLAFAPRNARGRVEVWADFVIYKPVDARRASDVALFEIPNRGGGSGNNLPAAQAGTGEQAFLMRQGLTIVHLGWQFDAVALRGAALRVQAPPLSDADRQITGLVRTYWVVDTATAYLPIGAASSYPALAAGSTDHTLVVRATPAEAPATIPRDAWRFARLEGGKVTPDSAHVMLEGMFRPGRMYELVYRSARPVLVGSGLGAVRDFAEYLKLDRSSVAPVRYAIARGYSQSGRFLRHFLYQGFNVGKAGRVFDGMYIALAGGSRGSFNHRFAQPSVASGFFPTRLFPFAATELTDPHTGTSDGLFARAGGPQNLPRIFYVDGGHEYWTNAASLTHTTPDGAQDVPLLSNERRYTLASADHTMNARDFPPPEDARLAGTDAFRGNPLETRPVQRALLVALIEWVRADRPPPDSRYPRLAAGTLVAPGAVRFPAIPRVTSARAATPIYHLDFGPRWSQGIVDHEPPRLGPPYEVRVGQVDSIGNELDGIRTFEVEVPLATYYPWQIRTGAPTGSPLQSDEGTWIPLPVSDATRRAGDTRPSIEALYTSRDDYLNRVAETLRRMIDSRFLLPEDSALELERAERMWSWIVQHREGTVRQQGDARSGRRL